MEAGPREAVEVEDGVVGRLKLVQTECQWLAQQLEVFRIPYYSWGPWLEGEEGSRAGMPQQREKGGLPGCNNRVKRETEGK